MANSLNHDKLVCQNSLFLTGSVYWEDVIPKSSSLTDPVSDAEKAAQYGISVGTHGVLRLRAYGNMYINGGDLKLGGINKEDNSEAIINATGSIALTNEQLLLKNGTTLIAGTDITLSGVEIALKSGASLTYNGSVTAKLQNVEHPSGIGVAFDTYQFVIEDLSLSRTGGGTSFISVVGNTDAFTTNVIDASFGTFNRNWHLDGAGKGSMFPADTNGNAASEVQFENIQKLIMSSGDDTLFLASSDSVLIESIDLGKGHNTVVNGTSLTSSNSNSLEWEVNGEHIVLVKNAGKVVVPQLSGVSEIVDSGKGVLVYRDALVKGDWVITGDYEGMLNSIFQFSGINKTTHDAPDGSYELCTVVNNDGTLRSAKMDSIELKQSIDIQGDVLHFTDDMRIISNDSLNIKGSQVVFGNAELSYSSLKIMVQEFLGRYGATRIDPSEYSFALGDVVVFKDSSSTDGKSALTVEFLGRDDVLDASATTGDAAWNVVPSKNVRDTGATSADGQYVRGDMLITFIGAEHIKAGSGTDTLTVVDTPKLSAQKMYAEWVLGAGGSGRVLRNDMALSFARIENISTGSANDTVYLKKGALYDTVDLGLGYNVFDVKPLGTAVDWEVNGDSRVIVKAVDGSAQINNVLKLSRIDGSGLGDTVTYRDVPDAQGPAQEAHWVITEGKQDSGSLNGLLFSGISTTTHLTLGGTYNLKGYMENIYIKHGGVHVTIYLGGLSNNLTFVRNVVITDMRDTGGAINSSLSTLLDNIIKDANELSTFEKTELALDGDSYTSIKNIGRNLARKSVLSFASVSAGHEYLVNNPGAQSHAGGVVPSCNTSSQDQGLKKLRKEEVVWGSNEQTKKRLESYTISEEVVPTSVEKTSESEHKVELKKKVEEKKARVDGEHESERKNLGQELTGNNGESGRKVDKHTSTES